MKKKTIFKHELNESIQANAAMNCLKNRNNHKQLNETSEFDARFEFRKDLRELASPATKKAYMIIRKEFGDGMWRRLHMDDCDERGLISQMNDYQKYYNITNPQDIADCMLGRKSVRSFKKSREQQEEEETTLSESELEDLTFKLADYLLESFIILEDEDEDYSNLLEAVEKILKKDAPKSNTEAGYYAWCRKWFMKIEDLTYSYYNEPNPESYYTDEEDEEIGINKHGMHNLVQHCHIMNTPSEHDEDEFEWVFDAARDIINKKFVGKSLTEIAPDQVKDDIRSMIMKEYKTRPRNAKEHYAWVHNIELAFDYATNYNFEREEQEEDYTNDEIPSPNFSYRMSFMVWAMREIIPYLKEISQVCAQADPTELKHAVMKILKTRDTGIPETHHSCQQWAKQNYDWVEMELNGEYDAYQEKWSKPFNIPSEQEEEVDVFELAVEVAQKNASKIARMSEQNACGVLMNELCKLTNRDFDTLDEEGDFDYYQDAALYGYASVVGYDDEEEELPQMERHDMILALAEDMAESWIDTGDDGDIDDIYYAIADILDKTGDYPQSTDWKDCKPWCQKYYKEVEARIY